MIDAKEAYSITNNNEQIIKNINFKIKEACKNGEYDIEINTSEYLNEIKDIFNALGYYTYFYNRINGDKILVIDWKNGDDEKINAKEAKNFSKNINLKKPPFIES